MLRLIIPMMRREICLRSLSRRSDEAINESPVAEELTENKKSPTF